MKNVSKIIAWKLKYAAYGLSKRNIMYQRCNRKKLHLLVKLESMMSDIIGKRIYFFKQFSSLFVVMNPMEFPGEIISTRNEISLIVLKNGIKIR